MSNKIFRTKTGKSIDLEDNYNEAKKHKGRIEQAIGEYMYWITPTHKPVFSSRGEYLGYKIGNFFETVE